MSVEIIIDSSADIASGIRDKLTVIPLSVFFGEKEYKDGVTISYKEFYEKLIESDVLPTTSQAPPTAFMEAFENVASRGDEAVVLTVSSRLSGTYQSAVIAAGDYAGRVYVVDTKNVAIGAGILALRALELKNQGLSAKEIYEILEKEKENVRLIAMLDTLEYLKKGGRISASAAVLGGMLSIKPVVALVDGEIKMLGKARGSKQANNLLLEEIEKAGGVDFSAPLLLGYTGLDDTLLRKYIDDSRLALRDMPENPEVSPIGSVVGTHAGPGAIAVAFFKKG